MVKSLDSKDYYRIVIDNTYKQSGETFLRSVLEELHKSTEKKVLQKADILRQSLQEEAYHEIVAVLGFILSTSEEINLAPDAVSVVVRHQLAGMMGPMVWSFHGLENSSLKEEFKKHLKKTLLLINEELMFCLEKQA